MGAKTQYTRPTFGTVSSAYISNTFDACVSLGCAPHLLITKIPGGFPSLQHPSKRFDGTVLIDLLHYAEELSGTIGIGALAGGYFRPSAMADLGHAMIASNTLEEMIKMFRIYQPIFLQIGRPDIHKLETQGFCTWESDVGDLEYLRPYVERFFGGVASFGRWVTWDEDMEIISMHFQHSRPANTTVYEDVFRCPVYFDADQNIMEVPRALIEHPMPQPNPALVASIKQILDRELATLETPNSITREVCLIIRSFLAEAPPSITNVAETMNTTERTLRRKLKNEGTTFREILENARRETCEFELSRGTSSIAALAQALGYSEQSAFTRAFKEWYGTPPSQYISQHRS